MKWPLHIFSRNKADVPPELAEQYRMLIAGDAQRPANEQRIHELMGIKREMMHDDWLEKVVELDALSVEFDPNDPTKLTGLQTNANSAAIRVSLSPRILTSILKAEDAAIYKAALEIRSIRTEMNMDKKTFNMGGLSLLQSLVDIAKMSLDSAIEGKAARIVNSISEQRTYSIQSGPQQEEKKRGLFG